MNQIKRADSLNEFYDEINFREILTALYKGKRLIFYITAGVSVLAVLYSLNLNNIYKSEALLAPIEADAVSNTFNKYGSLANLAGINLPIQSAGNNAPKAIEKIKSLSFFEKNIYPNIFLPELMALDSWDANKNLLLFDESSYDIKSNTWIRDYSFPNKLVPSPQESFIYFKSLLELNEDKKSNFISLSIKHQSPYVAKKWTELIVDEINTLFRVNDKSQAEKNIAFLNQQIEKTKNTDIKEYFYELLQEEIQKLMLIEANKSYVFAYIDPPAIMENKFYPRRSLICIFGAILGLILGISLVLSNYFLFKKEINH